MVVVDVVEQRKEKEMETQPGVPAWLQVVAGVLSPRGPRNVTDNIWYADTDESIINMPGWGEWVRGEGGAADEWVGE